jgi:hypothetical protein
MIGDPMPIPLFKDEAAIPKQMGMFTFEKIERYPNPSMGTKYTYSHGRVVISAYVYNQYANPIPTGMQADEHDLEFSTTVKGFTHFAQQQGTVT